MINLLSQPGKCLGMCTKQIYCAGKSETRNYQRNVELSRQSASIVKENKFKGLEKLIINLRSRSRF